MWLRRKESRDLEKGQNEQKHETIECEVRADQGEPVWQSGIATFPINQTRNIGDYGARRKTWTRRPVPREEFHLEGLNVDKEVQYISMRQLAEEMGAGRLYSSTNVDQDINSRAIIHQNKDE